MTEYYSIRCRLEPISGTIEFLRAATTDGQGATEDCGAVTLAMATRLEGVIRRGQVTKILDMPPRPILVRA